MWRTLLLCVVVAVGSTATTLFAVIEMSGPAKAAHPLVSFSEFLDEVEHGAVTAVRVHGRTYSFDVDRDGKRLTRETIGPAATLDELQKLRPSDPRLGAPKVSVE